MVKEKLRSQGGISIIFALLVLLVCMVVGSVVLTAGTAASGRLKKTAETDSRYYSLLSAAELLKKEYEGTQVIVKKNKTDTEQTTYTLTKTTDTNGNYQTDKSDVKNDTLPADYGSVYEETAIFHRLAAEYVLGTGSPEDVYVNTALPAAGSVSERDYTLTMSSADAPAEIPAGLLDVTVKVKMENDASVTFLLSSGTGSDTYRVTLRFACDLTQKTSAGIVPDTLTAAGKTYDGTANPFTETVYPDEKNKDICNVTEIRQTKEEKTYSFTWHFDGMEIS